MIDSSSHQRLIPSWEVLHTSRNTPVAILLILAWQRERQQPYPHIKLFTVLASDDRRRIRTMNNLIKLRQAHVSTLSQVYLFNGTIGTLVAMDLHSQSPSEYYERSLFLGREEVSDPSYLSWCNVDQ